MDSLTQIVLGAAVGEAILGKKIGNRAMVWGGIGGTIPDLDVIFGAFMDEADALAFHRGISHSFFFSIVGAFLFGWLVHRLYKNKEINASLKDWQLLFFGALFTHPILDSFTSYGTQLFAPFSNYRVAFGNISVADPLYTLPFLICLIVAAFYHRSNEKRQKWNYAGLIISSLYMIFTLVNKQRVTTIFERNLKEQGIAYSKKSMIPTILNNVLWYCIADTEDGYVQAHYSFFDKSDKMKFSTLQKNHQLLDGAENDKSVKILKWFTDGFYNVVQKSDQEYQLNDLRYGTFRMDKGADEQNFVFRFDLSKQKDGSFLMTDAEGGPERGSEKEMFRILWKRIKGL